MSQVKKSSHRDFYYDTIILAGGESRRFGCDKCDFEFNGKTMLQRVIENFEKPIIVTGKHRKTNGIEVIDCGKGPVNAVLKALSYVSQDRVFITGCDFPFITRKLTDYICSKNFDIVMPILDYPQPLLGCYSVKILKQFLPYITSFQQLIGKSSTYLIGTNELSMIDLSLRSLKNINNPNDLLDNRIFFSKSVIII
ncbi:molybdenum cofactor guanylyltransferase [Acidianus manzaensis]|uniref:Molybdenum cofactor guanylyltransferase n=1 Tax=Acidianus manzaensis TaxID=282676 RepID=A0A1W6JZQ8_9CREN|nr:molybdenum cofactor guanylyltransferase [Acidianus manzaensis]ARM75715.1 molybdenum cofactor guanylyltransferase [Acidianus manzaensis]